MNRRTIAALIGGVLAVGWSFPAGAEVKDNPYQIIIDRNPFGLRPIPPPPPPPDNTPPPAPPLGISMTGITTLLGPPKVFLELTDPQTKKVERPSALLEGDTYKDVTVVSIDTENNRVKIKNGDAESWLDFDKNGVKPAGAAGAAAVPPPGFPGAKPATASVPAPGAPTLMSSSAARGGLVSGGAPATAVPAPNNPNVPGASFPGVPARPIRTDGAGAGLIGGQNAPIVAPAAAAAAPTMTPAQAQAIIEARRMQLLEQGNPMSRILPPTALGQELKQLGQPR